LKTKPESKKPFTKKMSKFKGREMSTRVWRNNSTKRDRTSKKLKIRPRSMKRKPRGSLK
jgi:hypothetical protein